jgi:hypothetical protein
MNQVKLQIFDDVSVQDTGTNFIKNYSYYPDASDWTLGTGWSHISNRVRHTFGTAATLEQTNDQITENRKYKMLINVQRYNTSTAGTLILKGHLANSADLTLVDNTIITAGTNGALGNSSSRTLLYEWTQGNNNVGKLVLEASSTLGIEINFTFVSGFGLSDASIVGELDVFDHSEFPMSLNFQVNDVKDLQSRSGVFSKTFRIPATKNNNIVLKSAYFSASDNNGNDISNKKDCIILINDLISIKGLLQLKEIGFNESAEYYSCVFFADNLSWATLIEEKTLADIDFGSDAEDLLLQSNEIVATWSQANATTNTSKVVYPIVSYGEFNTASTQSHGIQLFDKYVKAGGTQTDAYFGIDDFGNPLPYNEPTLDWRPCIWVYDITHKIFNDVGFTIESSFIESDLFKKLIFATPNINFNNKQERYNTFLVLCGFNNITHSTTSSRILTSTSSSILGSTAQTFLEQPIDFTTAGGFIERSDVSGAFDGQVFTAQEYGFYDFNLQNFFVEVTNVRTTGGSGNPDKLIMEEIRIDIKVKTVGYTVDNTVFSYIVEDQQKKAKTSSQPQSDPISAQFPNETYTRYLNKGDEVRFSAHCQAKAKNNRGQTLSATFEFFAGTIDPNNLGGTAADNGLITISLQSDQPTYGQTYNLKDIMPNDISQIDFIKGISHSFNLQMTTDEASQKVFIEPYNDFYLDKGEALDWTYKVDRSQEATEEWLQTELKRDMIFKYKTDDKDVEAGTLSRLFNDIKDIYPYQETLSNDFEKGQVIFENPIFANSYMLDDKDTSDRDRDTIPFIPFLSEEDIGNSILDNFTAGDVAARADKGFEFLPRLFTWRQYSAAVQNPQIARKAVVSSNINNKRGIYADSLAITAFINTGQYTVSQAQDIVLSEIYPHAFSYNPEDPTLTNLSYGNIYSRTYDDTTNLYGSGQYVKGLYFTYYKFMIEQLKRKPRIKKLQIDLKVTDIINLDFRKLIYIDNVYYRLYKVNDYQPTKNTTTKVELIEWFDVGDFTADANNTVVLQVDNGGLS